MTEHEKELNRQAYALLENPCAEMHARPPMPRPQRTIPEDELADWLAEVGYGIDFRMTPDPPITLEALARAYMRVHPEDDVTLEDWIWTITQETGALSPSA